MSLFEELKRRNVFRVGLAYVLLGWALLQGADFTLDLVGAPEWVIRALAVLVAIGLPIALFFAWAFELTPEGIKRESEVDRSASVTPATGRKLDRAIIVFLVLVIAVMGLERFWRSDGAETAGPQISGPPAETVSSPGGTGPAKSIAVLPFADLSQDQDQGWFADGLAEEILNVLAKTPDLLVASRTSSFNYKDSDAGITTIAEELGVAHVLEGSVRSTGDRIRVTAQLIRASDGFHVWSENYDRDADDLIAIQEDVAKSIAGVLETTMDPAALSRMASAGTRSVEAYRAYLQGVSLQEAPFTTENEFRQARLAAYEQFERARALDAGFAAAHERAANFWRGQLSPTRSSTALTDRSAREALGEFLLRIDQAIATAANGTDRLAYQGSKAAVELRLGDAIELFSSYLEQRPNDVAVLEDLLDTASLTHQKNITDRVLDQLKERGLTDRQYGIIYLSNAYRLGRVEEAADFGIELVERWPTEASFVYQAHRTLLWAGRVLEARAMAERHRLLDPDPRNPILEARQACAEGDRVTTERLLADRDPDEPYDAGIIWHLQLLLGNGTGAQRTVMAFERTGIPYALAEFVRYEQFDPRPYPSLMRALDREGIEPQKPKPIPFACPPPEQTAIAVLPFVNMSPDPDNEYFSDGVSEEILNVLAAVPDLKVASRTSAFRYKGSELGIGEIAEELGVTHVLEGSVRKAGGQVRITAQLIQADDGFHLWSETYDRELTNIFAIQDEIAGSIAEVLQVELLGQGKGYTTVNDLSPDDYESFLKARFFMRQRNDDAIEEALALTRAILEDEPQFLAGMMLVAEALVQLDREEGPAQRAEVRALAERALAMEPNLPTAHMIQGQLAQDELRPLEAIRHYQHAIALDPNEPRPHHWLGIMLANSGFLERARKELQLAVDLEPDHANANGYLGFVLLLQGDYDGAQYHFDRQDQLGNPFGAQRRVQIAVLQGDLERAEALLERREGFNALEAERLRLFVAAARDPRVADAYLDFIDEHAFDTWHVALELLILGRFERALAFDLGGYPRASWAPRWSAARELPAFEQKIRRANLPAVWDALGPPPACRKLPTGYDCANGERP